MVSLGFLSPMEVCPSASFTMPGWLDLSLQTALKVTPVTPAASAHSCDSLLYCSVTLRSVSSSAGVCTLRVSVPKAST